MILVPILVLYAAAVTVGLAMAGLRPTARGPRPAPRPAARARPHHLLIVGATGGTGRELVAQALDRGYLVTALARDPAKLTTRHERLEVAPGNVLDPTTLDAALRGCDAVVCALGHKRFLWPTSIQSKGARHLVEAMRRQGATRLVAVTSLGLGDSAGRLGLIYTLLTLPFVLPFYFADKARQEQVIAGGPVDWVIVRPGALTRGPARGRYRQGRTAGGYLLTRSIARADVAAFMLDQLESDAYLRTAVGLSG